MEVATSLFLSFFCFLFFQMQVIEGSSAEHSLSQFLYFSLRAFCLSICQGVTNKTYGSYNNLFMLSFKDHY